MLKTVKGKVIAGTMAVGLLSSAGVALGATDAGVNLKAWYDAQFGKASASVKSDSDAYLQKSLAGMTDEVAELKTGAITKINDSRDSEIKDSTTEINKQASEYVDSIKLKKIEIEGYMDSEFGKIKDEAEETIFKAGTDFSSKAHSDMAKHTKQVGTMAQKNVQVELQKVTDRAISDIDDAIKNAKSELQAQLNTKATATTEEIKALVDKRIEEVRLFITMATNFMVEEQQGLIAKRAQQMEDNAKKQMEDLVNGI